MRAIIQQVIFRKEIDSQFGKLYSFRVKYDNEEAIYNSKSRDQKKFIAGEEAEFTEETKTYIDKKTGEEKSYLVIKPINPNKQSNYGKALNREKARYSAMCVSYAKDLVIGGRIQLSELSEYAWILFELVKEMDKNIEQ